MSDSKLPQSDSIRELAEFWDTHDLTDFENDLEEVSDLVFTRSREQRNRSETNLGAIEMTDTPDILGSDYQAFWSYVHQDNEAEGGRILDLATDVRSRYEMLTGEELKIFVDREGIEWGNWWRDQIDTGLASALFIAILTPRYFLSTECRRELHSFVKRASKLGVVELVLPILYIDVPAMHEDDPGDDLIGLVKDLQWVDWRELQFSDRTDSDYRRAVAKLADRLVLANQQAEEHTRSNIVGPVSSVVVDDEDEAPGVIDRLGDAEDAMAELPRILQAVAREVEAIGTNVTNATHDIQETKSNAGFSHRIVVAKRLASELEEPAERILTLGNQYTSTLYNVDAGIRTIFELAADEIQEDPSGAENFCTLIQSLRELATSSDEGLGQMQVFADTLEGAERLSRDLRPVLRTLRKGITLLVEGRDVITSWVQMAEQTDIEGLARTIQESARENGSESP